MAPETPPSPGGRYALTAVVVNYNGGERLLQTLRSLRAQADVRLQILLFDDGSTDDSVAMAERSGLVDSVHVSPVNTRNANQLRAAGMQAATTDLVLVTDNDVDFDLQCLATLARTLDEDPAIAAVTPAIYDSMDPVHPYSLGSLTHFLGLTARIADRDARIIDSSGSGITMYSKRRLGAVGTYDPELPIGWGDDSEFHQRIRLAGRRSVVNRSARAFHEFKPFSAGRAYRVRAAEHNRLRFIATHYSAGTIIGLLPLLIAFEIFQIGFFSVAGLGEPFMAGIAMFLGDLRGVAHRRRFVQGLRRRPDRDLLCADDVFIPAHARIGKGRLAPAIRFANALLAHYWRALVWLSRGRDKRSRSRDAEQCN